MIAQEVQEIDNNLVKKQKENDLLYINDYKLLMYVVKAIQELNKKVEELEKKL